MYLRTIKVRSSSGSINEYVRLVEAYRDNGQVKQRTLADLGRKDLLVEILPKLQRFLGGDRADAGEAEDPDILDASTWEGESGTREKAGRGRKRDEVRKRKRDGSESESGTGPLLAIWASRKVA